MANSPAEGIAGLREQILANVTVALRVLKDCTYNDLKQIHFDIITRCLNDSQYEAVVVYHGRNTVFATGGFSSSPQQALAGLLDTTSQMIQSLYAAGSLKEKATNKMQSMGKGYFNPHFETL